MGVTVGSFVDGKVLQYSLFDNRLKKDLLRKTMYNIKDKYGKNTVRKGSELFIPDIMKDAIGFGSVKDMLVEEGVIKNKYLLEEDE
jgi:DNA polymerase-4